MDTGAEFLTLTCKKIKAFHRPHSAPRLRKNTLRFEDEDEKHVVCKDLGITDFTSHILPSFVGTGGGSCDPGFWSANFNFVRRMRTAARRRAGVLNLQI